SHAVLDAAQHACGDQRLGRNRRLGVELAGVDGLLDPPERHDVEIARKDVVEAALGQTAVDRHLAAFIAVDRHARAGLLTLHAATAGLAEAGTDTAADALARLASAFLVAQFIEFHNSYSWRRGAITPRRRRVRGAVPLRSC